MDGEWILLDADRCIVTRLNETGGRIIELLDQEITIGALTEQLASEYDITYEQAQADLAKFLDNLKEADLLDERYES
ncbi:Coenzyme PQQ synthesis protein D [compost metagenome]